MTDLIKFCIMPSFCAKGCGKPENRTLSVDPPLFDGLLVRYVLAKGCGNAEIRTLSVDPPLFDGLLVRYVLAKGCGNAEIRTLSDF